MQDFTILGIYINTILFPRRILILCCEYTNSLVTDLLTLCHDESVIGASVLTATTLLRLGASILATVHRSQSRNSHHYLSRYHLCRLQTTIQPQI